MVPSDVHPDEQPTIGEALAFWAAVLLVIGGFWYAVARWVIAPIVRWVWPLLQPLVQAYGEQVLTAAVLAAAVLAIWMIARKK